MLRLEQKEHLIIIKCSNCGGLTKIDVQEVSTGVLLKAINIVNPRLVNAVSTCPGCNL